MQMSHMTKPVRLSLTPAPVRSWWKRQSHPDEESREEKEQKAVWVLLRHLYQSLVEAACGDVNEIRGWLQKTDAVRSLRFSHRNPGGFSEQPDFFGCSQYEWRSQDQEVWMLQAASATSITLWWREGTCKTRHTHCPHTPSSSFLPLLFLISFLVTHHVPSMVTVC